MSIPNPLVRQPPTTSHLTLLQILKHQADRASGSPAILAPSRAPLTYRSLLAQVERTVGSLNELGLGRNDRVAVVVPNGPEMAVAFVSVAAGAMQRVGQ